jgi:hypothetical protein
MTGPRPEHEPPNDLRAEPLGRIMSGVDLHQVTDTLAAARTEILEGWLESTSEQPFHAGRRASAVADHVPRLFDALVMRGQGHFMDEHYTDFDALFTIQTPT